MKPRILRINLELQKKSFQVKNIFIISGIFFKYFNLNKKSFNRKTKVKFETKELQLEKERIFSIKK